tara:strand:- start:322 stop:516 length:195 start_codon:yes stop_codon:yes gene_type:complete
MAEVIGFDESKKNKVTCSGCAAIITYYSNEVVNLWSGTDYGGGPDGADGFKCPNCGDDIILKRW